MDSFKEFILDQLSGLNPIRYKKMFGGYGIYYQELFFAIISDDRLYFKTDPISAKEFKSYEMEPFHPNPKQKLKNYYEVPEEILEDKEMLIQWARRSSECNNAKTKKK
jgi:DNA transformation protein and related proteins